MILNIQESPLCVGSTKAGRPPSYIPPQTVITTAHKADARPCIKEVRKRESNAGVDNELRATRKAIRPVQQAMSEIERSTADSEHTGEKIYYEGDP